MLNFHHILTRREDALISKVFWAQVNQPAKGDWCTVVAEDMSQIGLQALNFQDVKLMSQGTLRSLVKKKVMETAFHNLLVRQSSLSKLSSLQYDKLVIQPYLLDPDVPNRHKRLQFRWRTRMIMVNWNIGKKIKCPICNEQDDTQHHLLQCPSLNDRADAEMSMVNLERAIRKREVYLENKENS